MNRICIRTEGDETYRNAMDMMPMETNSQIADSITAAAWLVAEDVSAAAIVNYTSMGLTTIRTARQRPPMPIISLTPSRHVARKLMLSYGVSAFVVENVDNLDGSLKVACDLVRNAGLVKVGEHIVITAGVPFGIVGTTNLLRVEKICA
jgi:pyruvate kinase